MPIISPFLQPTADSVSIKLGQLVSSHLPLGTKDVHVFIAAIQEQIVPQLELCLSPDERERAQRFKFQPDRNRFIVARGLLRTSLASYLRLEPDKLAFNYSEKGKPSLRAPMGGSIQFNVAHSHELVIYAISHDRELGVDVEYIGREVDHEIIAERFFSAPEVAELRKLPAEERKQAFFNFWTRKEAFIKARGEGLSMPLNQFDVSLSPAEPAAPHNKIDPKEIDRWSVRSLAIAPDYVAALVVEGRDWQLRTFELQYP